MATVSQPTTRRPFLGIKVQDRVFGYLCLGAALTVLVLAAMLVIVLVHQSIPAMQKFGLAFLYTNAWNPEGQLGALAFVYGTVVTSLIAMLLAVPLGVGTAAFLSEIATGWTRRVGAFLIELLAAIPSVVYGFWGLFFLAPAVQWVFTALGYPNTGGNGIVCAGIILAIMVVPYVTAISFDVCQAVPRSQREGSLALGSTRWQMIWTVILPYARPGIVGGCILALGRALGETMAVVMLIGNQPVIQTSLDARGATVASVIALELNNTMSDDKRSALVELGLILLLVTIVINGLAALLIHRLGKRRRWALLGMSHDMFRNVRQKPERPSTEPPHPTPELGGRNQQAHFTDRLMTLVLGTFLILTCGPLFLILGYITFKGASALDVSFFTNTVLQSPPGLANAILGSAILVLLASVGAVPIGILTAIFLAEYRKHPLVPTVRFVSELLGGVPSVVVGILGYALLVSPFGHFSGWAGAFALGFLMVPIVVRSAEESLKLVPQSLRNASYALGGSYWQTVVRVTIPAALAPITTGVLLAMARIAGETAPLLLTSASNFFWTFSPDQPMPYLTYYIYTGALDPGEERRRLAWAGAFVLLTLVMLLNVSVRLLSGKRAVSATRAD